MSKVIHIVHLTFSDATRDALEYTMCGCFAYPSIFITTDLVFRKPRVKGFFDDICKDCINSEYMRYWINCNSIDMFFEDLSLMYQKSIEEILEDLDWTKRRMSTNKIISEIDYYHDRGSITAEQKGLLLLKLQ